jgi:hypothetical protein
MEKTIVSINAAVSHDLYTAFNDTIDHEVRELPSCDSVSYLQEIFQLRVTSRKYCNIIFTANVIIAEIYDGD